MNKMTIKKTLTWILAGALALGSTSCRKDHSQYSYNGKIGEDKVNFYEEKLYLTSDNNILKVVKPDGRVIKYIDLFEDDLKLEHAEITKNGQTTKYRRIDKIGKPIVEEAQRQFDNYLQKIADAKSKEREAKLKKMNAEINQAIEDLK